MTRTVLHIDRLVLRGFAAADGDAITAALRRELARQLASAQRAGRWPTDANVASLQLGRVSVGHGAGPEHVGAQLARTIVRGVKT